jgi:hypothetical protein
MKYKFKYNNTIHTVECDDVEHIHNKVSDIIPKLKGCNVIGYDVQPLVVDNNIQFVVRLNDLRISPIFASLNEAIDFFYEI